jgi:hypothetical protein
LGQTPAPQLHYGQRLGPGIWPVDSPWDAKTRRPGQRRPAPGTAQPLPGRRRRHPVHQRRPARAKPLLRNVLDQFHSTNVRQSGILMGVHSVGLLKAPGGFGDFQFL